MKPQGKKPFLGAWWQFLPLDERYRIYLQIQQSDLCFKIGDLPEHNYNRSSERLKWTKRLIDVANAKSYFEITKPSHPHSGKTMIVAKIAKKDWLGESEELLNEKMLVLKIKRYEQFLQEVVKDFNKV